MQTPEFNGACDDEELFLRQLEDDIAALGGVTLEEPPAAPSLSREQAILLARHAHQTALSVERCQRRALLSAAAVGLLLISPWTSVLPPLDAPVLLPSSPTVVSVQDGDAKPRVAARGPRDEWHLVEQFSRRQHLLASQLSPVM